MTLESKIIIGCMSWGKWGKSLSTKEQAELIQFCVDNGNNVFDHADIYGNYTTELEFGNALKESGISRDKIQLISKCGIQLVDENRNNKIKHYNYSKEYIIWSAEESLKKLNTDYLDVLLLHRPSPLMDVNEIATAISYLQKSGKIIQFGVSNFTPSQVELISKKCKVSINQIEFSITQHEALYDGTLDQMQKIGIKPLSWRPLGDIYKKQNEQTSRIKTVLLALADKYDTSDDVILLSWILAHPSGISPIIGTTNKERISRANRAIEIKLELEDWFTLLAASQGHRVP